MALPLLVNNADCGPVNPLQSLGKRFDQDRGIQQDQFGAGRAGSSRHTFRTPTSAVPGFDQDAARFFGQGSSSSQTRAPLSFNMDAIQHALPAAQPLKTSTAPPAATTAWAADFLSQQPAFTGSSSQTRTTVHAPGAIATNQQAEHIQTGSAIPTFQPHFNGSMNMMQAPVFVSSPLQVEQAAWDAVLQDLASSTASTKADLTPETAQASTSSSAQRSMPDDDLARTAGILLDSVAHDTSEKFKNSAFLGLMRQLRDGEVVVDGNDMVPADSQARIHADMKGKGKQRAAPVLEPVIDMTRNMNGQFIGRWNDGAQVQVAPELRTWFQEGLQGRSILDQKQDAARPETISSEDANDAYFRQENEEYIRYWQDKGRQRTDAGDQYSKLLNRMDENLSRFDGVLSPKSAYQKAEWAHLQDDWDKFEATATGIRAVSNYQFQANNPYVLGTSSRTTHHHAAHMGAYQSIYDNVLEMEAAVQREPTNADLWCALGVRQQENEREQKAIQALLRALELQPEHQSARLALAISFTNEGNRTSSVEALYEWVTRHEKFSAATTRPMDGSAQRTERVNSLVNCLLEMARGDASGEIEADIQIALAVLLNINEDWEKSGDCFRTALHVRPDDWLLWNRVGATLANSGHADQALEYYSQALQMNPMYIRARYNMGIALANLKRYGDAAEYFFDALLMQESDATRDAQGVEDRQGLTSGALWDSLKSACNRMQRSDLSSMCEKRDLEGFRRAFEIGSV